MRGERLLPEGMDTVDARLPGPAACRHPLGRRIRTALHLLGAGNGSPAPVLLQGLNADPRYGHGKPPHRGLLELIEARRGAYRTVLGGFLRFADDLARIQRRRTLESDTEPAWFNRFLPGLDAASLYCLVAQTNPRRYIEVGSGNSTMFVRRAIRDHHLRTRICSIDPYPRETIDSICDEVVRQPLGEADLTRFGEAEPGDVVFLDGSHLVLPGSDVVVAFLDILPHLRPGVIVQVHDIWLPYDYPARWNDRLYSEQYMLAVAILSAPTRYEVLLPNMFIASDPELREILSPLWCREQFQGVPRHGGSFWLTIR